MKCPLAHSLEECPAVKAALAQPTDASTDELVDVHVRISLGDLPGPQHLDFGTHRQLLDRLFFESPVCRLVLGDEHIAGTTEVDLGRLPVDLHTFVEVGNELGTEPAQLNVERIGVLLPDAVLRPRRVRIVVGPVGLDNEHRPVEVRVLREEVGGCSARHCTADADDVVARRQHGHVTYPCRRSFSTASGLRSAGSP